MCPTSEETKNTTQPNDTAVNQTLFDLYGKIRSTRRNQSMMRLVFTVLILVVLGIFAVSLSSIYQSFDVDTLYAELERGFVEETGPKAMGMVQEVLEQDKAEVLARVDNVLTRHAPAFQKAADREISLISSEVSSNMEQIFREFLDGHIQAQAEILFAEYPELADEELRSALITDLQVAMDQTVAEVMTSELGAIQYNVDSLQRTLSAPEVRRQIDAVKEDPELRKKFFRIFFSMMAEPFVQE